MPELRIEEIATAINGDIVNRYEDAEKNRFVHFHFDTRAIDDTTDAGTLFFALQSETNDGHRYVPELKTGNAAVVCRDFDITGITIPLIRVDDTLKAAQQLAAYVRKKYNHIKYIGITGSAGKTSTKEFIYHLLSHKYIAYRSFKNWNNWIGMPFSILNMKGDETAAVFEMAMSYPGIGEINLLAGILKPDVAVILNAFPVHLEFLETIENVARAKAEILDFMAADSIAFINGDQDHLVEAIKSKKGRKVFFGQESKRNHVRLLDITTKENHSIMTVDVYGMTTQFEAAFINRVHVENLFISIMVAQHLGMKHDEIRDALSNIKPMAGRGEVREENGFTIIDETYNSNPEALKRTMAWVEKSFPGHKIAVVGDMLELGDNETVFHREVGNVFAGLDFNHLITVGPRAREIAQGALDAGVSPEHVTRFDSATDAGVYLKEIARPGSAILFKASRGIRLENAITSFLAPDLPAEPQPAKKNQRIAVVGFGRTGKALLDFLLRQKKLNTNQTGAANTNTIYLYNDSPITGDEKNAKSQYEAQGITFLIGESHFRKLGDMEMVLISPGVDGRSKRFQMLNEKAVPVVSEIEFASWHIDAPIIAVTGTNGKSTTVSLIHHFLEKNGIKSFLTGNIGSPLIAEVSRIQKENPEKCAVVVEVSSFQLEEIKKFKPHIAAILNITPDHLDRYRDIDAYTETKLDIGINQTGEDYIILNAGDERLACNDHIKGNARIIWFSAGVTDPSSKASNANNNAIIRKDSIYLKWDDIDDTISLAKNPLKGAHNQENILAAAVAARLMGVSAQGIEQALADFRGLPHRMETAGHLGNVEFINDSKATNVDAALKSIQGINDNLVLILGGKDKGGDFTLLRKTIQQKVQKILLIGSAAESIHKQLTGQNDSPDNHFISKDRFQYVSDFTEAVKTGFNFLEKTGGVVLLAPGCASFDMFDNFEHRGKVFKETVEAFIKEKEACIKNDSNTDRNEAKQ